MEESLLDIVRVVDVFNSIPNTENIEAASIAVKTIDINGKKYQVQIRIAANENEWISYDEVAF